ncbi:MAG: hypothetical protein J1F43_06675 [Muribaculaceae bacterium]|nr:hypothetical protein [Muribaculaceae bacterium]
MNNKLILTSLFAAGLMLTTACSSENVWDYDGSQTHPESDYVDVTFSVAPESSTLTTRGLTRADGEASAPGGPGQWQTISRGSEIDMLVYAVYDEDLTQLTQYGEGLLAAEDLEPFTTDTPALTGTQHTGQTVVNVGKILADGDAYKVTLRLMRKKTYTVAFWAQSSNTTAYNTENLRHVEVNYSNALNNDELRDAFCKAEKFTVTDGGLTQDVDLTRPLAQINVGTTGADYKNLEKGALTGSTHKKVTYSKVEIKNVAKYLDIVVNKVLTDADIEGATSENSPYYGLAGKATQDVTFNWNKIPAYYAMEVPTSGNLYEKADQEELLKIDLDHDGEILDYKTSYPTLGSKGSYMTEAFKYLSMSYVLVSAPKAASSDQNLDEWINNSKVIDSVTVYFADNNSGTDSFQALSVSNVPAQTNWRTNILGGLQWMKDPTDPNPDPENPDNPYNDPDYPDNPDDPNNPYDPVPPAGPDKSTLFNTQYLEPIIVNDFFDDHRTGIVNDNKNAQ